MYPAIQVPKYLCWHPRELFRFNMIYGDQPIFKCWSVSTSLSLKGVNIIWNLESGLDVMLYQFSTPTTNKSAIEACWATSFNVGSVWVSVWGLLKSVKQDEDGARAQMAKSLRLLFMILFQTWLMAGRRIVLFTHDWTKVFSIAATNKKISQTCTLTPEDNKTQVNGAWPCLLHLHIKYFSLLFAFVTLIWISDTFFCQFYLSQDHCCSETAL